MIAACASDLMVTRDFALLVLLVAVNALMLHIHIGSKGR